MPPQPPRMQSLRLLLKPRRRSPLLLLASIGGPGVEQVPFHVLDLDDEAGKPRIVIGVKAGVVAGYAREANAL